ncbi:hypothetical protein KA977_02695, partial [Candidatus Dependentiae bacterium]|nr:hypothetical protein [Candidatus Dependentiae bacterium]
IGYDAKSAIYWYAAAGANLLYSGKTQKSTIKITNANNMNNKISFMFEEKNLDIKKDWDIKFNEKKNIFQVDAFLKVEENSTFDIKFYYCDDRQEPNADIYNELKQKNKKLIADVIEYMRKLIIDKCGIEYEIDKTNKQIVINKVRENSIANNLFKTGEILVYFNEYEWIKMKDLGIDNIETFLEFSLIELFKVPRL